jgi:hypothetical protein
MGIFPFLFNFGAYKASEISELEQGEQGGGATAERKTINRG